MGDTETKEVCLNEDLHIVTDHMRQSNTERSDEEEVTYYDY